MPTDFPPSPVEQYLAPVVDKMRANNAKGPTPYPTPAATAAPEASPYPVPAAAPAAPAASPIDDLEAKRMAALNDYMGASKSTVPSDIIEKMKLKTGGVTDVDNRIDELRAESAAARPKLMAAYAHLDPAQREALIAGEEQRINTEIARYANLRQSRLGTISEMINAEIKDKETDLQKKQLAFDMYSKVIGDQRQAEQFAKQIEQGAAQLDLLRANAKRAEIETAATAKAYGVDYFGAGSGTLVDKNNNPGNLRDPKTGAFRTFTSPQEGIAAMERDIFAKVNGQSPASRAKLGRDATTLKELISVYAPKEDSNNPDSYAAAVARQLGVSPDEPLANLKGKESELAQAMAKHEGWTKGWTSGAQKPFNADEYLKGLATTNDPQAAISGVSSAQADAILQRPDAANLPEAYAEGLLQKASPAVANAYAQAANVSEMKTTVASNDAETIAQAIIELNKKKIPPAQIKTILQEAGFSFGGNWMPWSNLSESVAKKIAKVKGLEGLAGELE